MDELRIFDPGNLRDPKLGIKSSLSDFKQTVAMASLHFLASTEPTLDIVEKDSGDGLTFTTVQMENVASLYESNGFEQSTIEEIRDAASKSALLTTQIEPLIVALELFIPLAEITFSSNSIGLSAERTGGNRYPKTLRYAGGLFELCGGTRIPTPELLKVFRAWLLDKSIDPSTLPLEKDLKRRIFSLVSQTQFRVTREKSGESAIQFNALGLYDFLLENEHVTFDMDEKKGTTRILFSALRQRMLPGLRFKGNSVYLDIGDDSDSGFSSEEIEMIFQLEVRKRELLKVKDIATMNDPGSSFAGLGVRNTVDLGYSGVGVELSIPRSAMNVIYYGVPGSGKSYEIDRLIGPDDHVERVVFHPDYLYSTFVGQILPHSEDGKVSYEFKPGPFTKLLDSAVRNPDDEHVLVIEEINRGSAAAIFGDVFQLLDRADNGESKYKVSNPEISAYITGDPNGLIGIPSNMRLLATMNTSDQNVFTLDSAFQRRWSMKMVRNDITKVSYADTRILDTSVTWRQFNTVINEVILGSNQEMASTEDKRLGAFFVREDELACVEEKSSLNPFGEKVIKYLWDDAFKFNRDALFLNSEEVSLEELLVRFNESERDDRWNRIFRSDVCSKLILSPSKAHDIEF